MSRKTILTVILVVLLAAGGVYAVLRNTKPTTSTSSTATALSKPAPDFDVKTIDGQQFSLAAHKGKPVIVFAMFGGCGDCIPVGQTLSQIQNDYAAKGVSVVAMDILKGEPVSVLEQYRSDIKASFKLVSYDENVVKAYKLTAPEITYVIDKNGNIANVNQSALNYEQYKQQVEQAL